MPSGKRKIKPETRIGYLRRDVRTLRTMLEWAGREFQRIAEGSKAGVAVGEAATHAARECLQWVARVR